MVPNKIFIIITLLGNSIYMVLVDTGTVTVSKGSGIINVIPWNPWDREDHQRDISERSTSSCMWYIYQNILPCQQAQFLSDFYQSRIYWLHKLVVEIVDFLHWCCPSDVSESQRCVKSLVTFHLWRALVPLKESSETATVTLTTIRTALKNTTQTQ